MAWFDKTFNEFQKLVLPFAGKPITYVEVGVWKGDSAAWMCENVLTHPEAIGYGFDPYLPDAKHSKAEVNAIEIEADKRLKQYVSKTPDGMEFRKFDLQVMDSVTGLRNFCRVTGQHLSNIDLLYLDGDHTAGAVVCDWCAAWPLLKVGSVVIFDDWGVGKRKHHRHVPEAFDAIVLAFADMIDVIHQGPKQAAVRVRSKEPPMEEKMARMARIRARGDRK